MTIAETGRVGIIVSGGGENPTMYVSEKVLDPVKGGNTDRLLWRVHSRSSEGLQERQKVTISPDGSVAYTEDGGVIHSWFGNQG